MQALILFFLSLQLLSFNALSDSKFQRNEVTEISEVEDLAPVNNDTLPISYHWTKDTYSANKLRNNSLTTKAASAPSPLMTYHNNSVSNVMNSVITTPIFWGAKWANPSYQSDKIIGLERFYNNIGNSTYANTVSEYLVSLNTNGATISKKDTSTASNNTTNILNKVCKLVGTNVSTTGFYPVYTDIKRGNNNYCAFHSAGVCGTTTIQFAFFFDLNDDAGCDPVSSYAPARGSLGSQNPGLAGNGSPSYQQSQGLAALANVSAHELMETLTDPAYFPTQNKSYWSGWYDSTGAENGDKCAWTFGPSNKGLAGTVNIGGFNWKLQGEWSNLAQSNSSGYPTTSSTYGNLKGCVTGS